MGLVTAPSGDPGAIRDVAEHLDGMAETLSGTRVTELAEQSAVVDEAIPDRRAPEFAALSIDGALLIEESSEVMAGVAGKLAEYADVLEGAQKAIAAAIDGHEKARSNRDSASLYAEPELAAAFEDDMREHADAGLAAREAYDAEVAEITAGLAGLGEMFIPADGATAPVDAWSQTVIALLPPGFTATVDQMNDWYTDGDPSKQDMLRVGNAVKDLVADSVHTYQGIGLIGSERALEKVDAAWSRVRDLGIDDGRVDARLRGTSLSAAHLYFTELRNYRAPTPALVTAHGRYATNPAGVAMFALQDVQAGRIGDPPQPGLGARVSDGLGRAGAFANRVLGPLGMITGPWDMYRAFTSDDMSATDRTVTGIGGLATTGAGTAVAASLTGVIALTPVGLTLVGIAGLVGTGAWVHQNWDTVVDAGGWVVDRGRDAISWAADKGGDLVGGLGNLGQRAWNGLFGSNDLPKGQLYKFDRTKIEATA